jgi:hypothetical protein
MMDFLFRSLRPVVLAGMNGWQMPFIAFKKIQPRIATNFHECVWRRTHPTVTNFQAISRAIPLIRVNSCKFVAKGFFLKSIAFYNARLYWGRKFRQS